MIRFCVLWVVDLGIEEAKETLKLCGPNNQGCVVRVYYYFGDPNHFGVTAIVTY